jgi:hypothetical protein
MGSKSDWDTMQYAAQILDALGVPHETKIVSAHRTPDLLFEYAGSAEQRGLEVIIAGAGGAAHLPGIGGTGRIEGAAGYRLAPLDRANARWSAGWNSGHRQAWGDQRRVARRVDSRHQSA